jgi:hypothetical protein
LLELLPFIKTKVPRDLNNLSIGTFTENNCTAGSAEYIVMETFYKMKSYNTNYFTIVVRVIGVKFGWMVDRTSNLKAV